MRIKFFKSFIKFVSFVIIFILFGALEDEGCIVTSDLVFNLFFIYFTVYIFMIIIIWKSVPSILHYLVSTIALLLDSIVFYPLIFIILFRVIIPPINIFGLAITILVISILLYNNIIDAKLILADSYQKESKNRGNKLKKVVLLTFYTLLLLIFTVIWLLNSTHWTSKEFLDETEVQLPKKLTKMSELFDIATTYATNIYKGFVLYDAGIIIKSKKQIINETGEVRLRFKANNPDFYGFKSAYYTVIIDLEKQAVVYRDMISVNEEASIVIPLSIGNVDLKDVFTVLKRPEIYSKISELKEPFAIVVSSGKGEWSIAIRPDPDSVNAKYYINIDSKHKGYTITEDK